MVTATITETITAAFETATTLAGKCFDFVTSNEWLGLIFVVGTIVPIGFMVIRKAKNFAKR